MPKRELRAWRMAVWLALCDSWDRQLDVFLKLWYGELLDSGK